MKKAKANVSKGLKKAIGPNAIKIYSLEELEIIKELSAKSEAGKSLAAKLLVQPISSDPQMMISISTQLMGAMGALESKLKKE